jgi:hypothetical protein
MAFAGLRGSRSATIWSLFWATGLVHLYLRPIPRRLVPLGLAGVVAFMYAYGFYKAGGVKGLENFFEGAEARREYAEKSGRTVEAALLWDFGRADVQAFLLYRLADFPGGYDLAMGRTYVGTAFLLVPRQVMPDRPPLKNKFGTDLMYGRGSYVPGVWVSSNVYGLAGETMLNFGPWAVPLGYCALGAVVGYVSSAARRLARGDARLLIYPFAANVVFNMLVGDSDNTLILLFQYGLIPVSVVLIGSRFVGRRENAPAAARDAVAADAVGGVSPVVAGPRWGRRRLPGNGPAGPAAAGLDAPAPRSAPARGWRGGGRVG